MFPQPGPLEFLAAFAMVLVAGCVAGFALGWRQFRSRTARG